MKSFKKRHKNVTKIINKDIKNALKTLLNIYNLLILRWCRQLHK